MNTVLNSITITRPLASYEVTLLRAANQSIWLKIYELAQGVGHASLVEEINLDKNPELFHLYDWKHNQFRTGEVNDLLKAIEEVRELECSTL